MQSGAMYLILRTIERLNNLNLYIWEKMSPVYGTDILEVGSGVGVYTDYLLKAGKRVLSIDIVPGAIQELHKKFCAEYPNLEAMVIDISDDLIAEKIKRRFDTIICLNVLEHIKDDKKALSNMAQLLKNNGRLILLIPAFKFLYGSVDKSVGHYRRYSYREIESKLNKAGFSVQKRFYLHFMGILGWFVRSRITKNEILTERDLKLYDRLMPLFKIMDKITFGLAGQSLVVISRVNTSRAIGYPDPPFLQMKTRAEGL